MRIVLEGCDCTGKSTLAQVLAKRIKEVFGVSEVMHFHEGLPPVMINLFEYYALKALAYDFCIHDRLHLGECTYGMVYRCDDRLGPIGQHIIDHIIRSNGFGIICNPPLEDVVKCWQKRIDCEYVKDQSSLRRVYESYRTYSEGDGGAWWMIDPFQLLEQDAVLRRIQLHSLRYKSIPFIYGIGPSTAETLIVGEMSNHPVHDLPFFSTTGSSAYLIKTLMSLGIGHDYYLTNASYIDGSLRLMRPIIKELRRLKRVFALGHQATKLLRQQEIPCISMPHPQFYNRFKHHEEVDYLKLFKLGMEANHADQLLLL